MIEDFKVIISAEIGKLKSGVKQAKEAIAQIPEKVSVDVEVNAAKDQIKQVSNEAAQNIKVTAEMVEAAYKKVPEETRKQWVETLDNMVNVMNMKWQGLLKKRNDALDKYGVGSTQVLEVSDEFDSYNKYYEALKKFKEAIENGTMNFDDSTFKSIPKDFQEASIQADALNQKMASIGEVTDYTTFIDQALEAWNKFERIQRQLRTAPKINEASGKELYNVDMLTAKLAEAKAELDKIIKAFLELKGINIQDIIKLPGIKDSKLGDYLGSGLFNTPVQQQKKTSASTGNTAKSIVTGIFAVRSIYALVRKLVSQNEALSEAIDNLFATLGNIIAPIANSIAALFNWINTWLGKIFGVNTETAKATSTTARSLANFDEINNIDSGSSTSDSSDINDADNRASNIEMILGGLAQQIWGILEIVAGVIGAICIAIMGVGQLVVDSVIGLIAVLISTIWNTVKALIQSIVVAIGGIVSIAGGVISVIWGLIKGLFTGSWDELKKAWENLKTLIKSLGETFVSIWSGVWDKIKTVAMNYLINPIKDAWNRFFVNGVKPCIDLMSTGWNNIKSGFKNTINGIIGMLNKVITAFNKIPGISLKSIPYLAKGGIVNQPTIAMVGEAGPEAVVPLDKLNTMLNNKRTEELLQVLINRVDGLELNPYVTVKDIGQASVNYINKQSKIKGVSVVGV